MVFWFKKVKKKKKRTSDSANTPVQWCEGEKARPIGDLVAGCRQHPSNWLLWPFSLEVHKWFCVTFSKAFHLMAAGKQRSLWFWFYNITHEARVNRILNLALLFLVAMTFCYCCGFFPCYFPLAGLCIWLVGLFCLLRQGLTLQPKLASNSLS